MTVVMKDSYTPPLPIPHISKHKKAPRLKVGNYDKRKQGFPDSQFDNLDRFTFEEESEMYVCLNCDNIRMCQTKMKQSRLVPVHFCKTFHIISAKRDGHL